MQHLILDEYLRTIRTIDCEEWRTAVSIAKRIRAEGEERAMFIAQQTASGRITEIKKIGE